MHDINGTYLTHHKAQAIGGCRVNRMRDEDGVGLVRSDGHGGAERPPLPADTVLTDQLLEKRWSRDRTSYHNKSG